MIRNSKLQYITPPKNKEEKQFKVAAKNSHNKHMNNTHGDIDYYSLFT
jgi:hypothetical protein